MKRNAYLFETLKRIENDTFDERDIKLLLIEIRDLLTNESFLREVADFIAHPERERGLCHITINSRYAKMKFSQEGIQRLIDSGTFAKNSDKPYSFFSNQILDYIQTVKIKRDLFEIIIREGIEEIPENLFLQHYKINKDKVRTIVFSSYIKSNGFYQLKPEIKGKDFLLLDDLLKFIRGTITGISAFNGKDLKLDLFSGITRIINTLQIRIGLDNIVSQFDNIIVCIISILHESTFRMFDGTVATAYITASRADALKDDTTPYLSLNIQTPNFSFPLISTDIRLNRYVAFDDEYIKGYEGLPLPWNYTERNEDNILKLVKNY